MKLWQLQAMRECLDEYIVVAQTKLEAVTLFQNSPKSAWIFEKNLIEKGYYRIISFPSNEVIEILD